VLSGQPLDRTEPLYWHFNRAAGYFQVAMRDGDWKILARLDKRPSGGNNVTAAEEADFKAAEPIQFALYNLRDDIAEKHDLIAMQPAKFEELKGRLMKKYYEVREESSTWPDWTFDNREGVKIEWPDYVKKAKSKKGQK
jgi:arylsulfatase A